MVILSCVSDIQITGVERDATDTTTGISAGSRAPKLPRHYVTRQKLCLRATTDYWVNAMDGAPFFRVEKPIDPGLLKVLKEDIIPWLEKEIPNQPTAEELVKNRYLNRFILVFDREGYSPGFFSEAWQKRIAPANGLWSVHP